MNKMKSASIAWMIVVSLLWSCGQPAPHIPRPRAYPKIEFPEKGFKTFQDTGCPFSFQYPSYAEIKTKEDNPCWFDLYIASFNANLHCSYMSIRSQEELDEMVKDVFIIADKINERANSMQEKPFTNKNGVNGLVLEWTGKAASPLHFYLSDSLHFFRASLYFNSHVESDSIGPIVKFLKEDINNLIETFEFK